MESGTRIGSFWACNQGAVSANANARISLGDTRSQCRRHGKSRETDFGVRRHVAAFSSDATCLLVSKRGHVRALQRPPVRIRPTYSIDFIGAVCQDAVVQAHW